MLGDYFPLSPKTSFAFNSPEIYLINFSKYLFFSDLVSRTLFIFSFFLICSLLHLFCFSFREVDGQWVEEEKLEAHSDWVRDVAWATNVGLPVSTIASCSQVK